MVVEFCIENTLLISPEKAIIRVFVVSTFWKLKRTTDSDTVSTNQVSSVQLETNKKLEALNKA